MLSDFLIDYLSTKFASDYAAGEGSFGGRYFVAVKTFSVPGQNIIYADTIGNIGWRAAARIPIRKDGESLVPRPGWDSDYDWKGFVPFDEMPYIYNPQKGYIATANNKIVDESFPYYISNQWAEPSRIERIEELIENKEKLNVNDMKKIQNDRLSSFAREVTPNIIKHVAPFPT